MTEHDLTTMIWHAKVFELVRLLDISEEQAATYIYVTLLLAEKNGEK
jgi:hypothetical protein